MKGNALAKEEACSLLTSEARKEIGCHYKDGWLLAGKIAVDTATVYIADPVNLPPVFNDGVENEMLDISSRGFGNYNHGLVSHTFGGDGSFPVYVKLKKETPEAIYVDFSRGDLFPFLKDDNL